MQFRNRSRNQGTQAARKYVRNIIEAHHSDALDERRVEDLLGLNNALPYFNNSLPVIPYTQISRISARAFGHGANGAVYAAQWKRPTGALGATHQAPSDVPVVLREMFQLVQGGNTSQRFLKEVHVSFGVR